MGTQIKVIGIDPSLRNFGFAEIHLELETMQLEVTDLLLVHTENESGKQVRKNSDDIRCARMHVEAMAKLCKGAAFAIAELPAGTQSARGAFSNGVCLGVLAACPIPLIQVSPTEVKRAMTGNRTATKEQMIDAAVRRHPDAPWLRYKRHGEMHLTDSNEHLADAVAAVYAGIKTDQFKQASAILMTMKAA